MEFENRKFPMEKKIDSDIKTTPIGILEIQKFRVTRN